MTGSVGDIFNLQMGVMDAHASDLSDITTLLLLQFLSDPPAVYYYSLFTVLRHPNLHNGIRISKER